MIVQNITDDGKFASLTFTVPVEDERKSLKELRSSDIKFKRIHSNSSICKSQLLELG